MYEIVKNLGDVVRSLRCSFSTFGNANGDERWRSRVFRFDQIDIHIVDVFQLVFEDFEVLLCICKEFNRDV